MNQRLTTEERIAMIRLYVDNARDMLETTADNIRDGHYKSAINRMYYGCFYIVTGLLLGRQISPGTHQGTSNQFSLHYIHSGRLSVKYARIYGRLLEERSRGDYDIFTLFDKETTEEYFLQAQDFVDTIEKLIREESQI